MDCVWSACGQRVVSTWLALLPLLPPPSLPFLSLSDYGRTWRDELVYHPGHEPGPFQCGPVLHLNPPCHHRQLLHICVVAVGGARWAMGGKANETMGLKARAPAPAPMPAKVLPQRCRASASVGAMVIAALPDHPTNLPWRTRRRVLTVCPRRIHASAFLAKHSAPTGMRLSWMTPSNSG